MKTFLIVFYYRSNFSFEFYSFSIEVTLDFQVAVCGIARFMDADLIDISFTDG